MTITHSPDTRLTRTDKFLQAAEANDWSIDTDGKVITLTAPDHMLGKFMEPQIVEVHDDGTGHLERDGPHRIFTTINKNVGESFYGISGGGAYKAVKNAQHPLRSRIFFALVGNKSDAELCEPADILPASLRNLRVKGYMTSAEADKYSIALLKLHPAEVFGGDLWIDAAERKFK